MGSMRSPWEWDYKNVAQNRMGWGKCDGNRGSILTTTCPFPPRYFQFSVFSERELTFTFAIWYRPSVCLSSICLSVVCNVRAPYSGGSNFRQYFYDIRYLGQPLTYWKFHGDRPRETPPPGELNRRGAAKYRDFGPIDGYISETVQYRR